MNDTYGHSMGDQVLVEVARRLSGELREDELLARYGGDEFVWVSTDSKEDLELDGLIARLKAAFGQDLVIRQTTLTIGISIGSALFPTHGSNMTALFDVADEDMYRDKRRSKSRRGSTDGKPPA